MTQGVVLFDINGRLVVCNEQYRTMYELSPEVVNPGAALIDIIRNRISSGSLSRGAEEYCEEIMSQIAAGKTLSFVNETPDRQKHAELIAFQAVDCVFAQAVLAQLRRRCP